MRTDINSYTQTVSYLIFLRLIGSYDPRVASPSFDEIVPQQQRAEHEDAAEPQPHTVVNIHHPCHVEPKLPTENNPSQLIASHAQTIFFFFLRETLFSRKLYLKNFNIKIEVLNITSNKTFFF